jgi:fatty acid desaturase
MMSETISESTHQPAPKRPPQLPAAFFQTPRPWVVVAFLTYAMTMAFGPGFLSYWLVVHSGWSWLALVLPITALSCVSGFGFYVMAYLGHEGFHFTLMKNQFLSSLIGTWFSSAVAAFFSVGFYLVHSRHHRFTNQENDPDVQLFSQFTSTWRRLLVLRLVNNRVYAKLVIRLLIKNELPEGTQTVFTLKQLKMLGVSNVLAQIFWISLYVAVFMHDTRLGLCLVLLPHIATAFISAAIVFMQHADTGELPSDNARTHSSLWTTLLMGGSNFHLEHHLYPRVPCWRLRSVHAWLEKTNWAETNPRKIEPRFWLGFTYFLGRHKYGLR